MSETTGDYTPPQNPISIITIPTSVQPTKKLTRTNFPQWRSHINAILNGLDLQHFVDDSTPPPSPNSSTYKSWYQQDQLILATLMASLSEDVSPYVSSCHTARDAWKSLHDIFASRSRARVMQLRTDLGKASMGSRSIREYLHSLRSKADELALIDTSLSDDDFTCYALNGLSTRFREVVASIRVQPHSIPFPALLDLLVAHEVYVDGFDESAVLPVTANASQTGHPGRGNGGPPSQWTNNRGTRGNGRGRGRNGRFSGRNNNNFNQNYLLEQSKP